MTITRTRSPRLRAFPLAAGTAIAAGLVLAAPLAASAHVTVSPNEGTAGGYSVLTFAFSHGCDGSPTTGLTIDIPADVASVAPEIQPGWTIERVGADDGVPTQLVYTPDAPIESGLRAALNVQVAFSEQAGGTTVAFPVVQTCAEGETQWTQIPAEGEDPHSLDSPAPTVAVAEATAEDAHGHADASGDMSETTASENAPANDALPIALGASGLVLGLGALVVALTALRRSKRA